MRRRQALRRQPAGKRPAGLRREDRVQGNEASSNSFIGQKRDFPPFGEDRPNRACWSVLMDVSRSISRSPVKWSVMYAFARPLLFALDPETAHELTLWSLHHFGGVLPHKAVQGT